MKFLPLILLLLIQSATVIAQPGIHGTYGSKPYDTLVTGAGATQHVRVVDKRGKIRERYTMVNGNKEGLAQIFGRDSLLVLSAYYKGGLLCGEWVAYNEYDGSVQEKKNYDCNVGLNKSWLDGPYERYNRNVLLQKGNYKDSLKEGAFYEYDYNGRLKSTANYHKGLLKGDRLEYNPGGVVVSKTSYIIITDSGRPESVLHGKASYYSYSGALAVEGKYVKGKKEGLWVEYDDKGKLQKETLYKAGKVHGVRNTYYYESGLPEMKSTFYEEIEVNGKLLKNVLDGTYERYGSNGRLQLREHYNMGKPAGKSVSYYEDGTVRQEKNFEDGLLLKDVYYDTKGNHSLEINYKISKQDSVFVSVKDGPELSWKNNVLVEEANYTNGQANGAAKSYYPSGKLAASKYFVNGAPVGRWIDYYENGQVREDRVYDSFPGSSSNIKYKTTGWRYTWAEDGKLLSKSLYDSSDKILVQHTYSDGIPAKYVCSIFELSYFPNGKLMSQKLGEVNNVVSWQYYLDGRLRKITFSNPVYLNSNQVEFLDDGTLHYTSGGYYNNPDTLLPDEKTVNAVLNASWFTRQKSPLYTDSIKDGKYKLAYKNGKPFAALSFLNDVPDGDFVFYHPVTNDTILFARFSNGVLDGPWIEKFAGKNEWRRGHYSRGKKAGKWISNNITGIHYDNHYFDPVTGKDTAYDSYQNGRLYLHENWADTTHTAYDSAGLITSKSELISRSPNVRRTVQYYPNSRIIKSEMITVNGKRDSTDSYYFPSGKVQGVYHYKNNKRQGAYTEYDEAGNVVKRGNYKNDVLDGLFIVNKKTGTDSLYYKNGNLQVKPQSFACACIDTSLSNGGIQFAPTLDGLLDYDKLIAVTGKYLLPVDSFNYSSIFYVGYQFSNGHDAGFSTMKLLMFKELAVRLPASGELKLILNPCKTEGYISNMEVSASYSYEKAENTYASFYPKRIAVEFLEGPVKSNSADHVHFKAFFDCKGIDYNYEAALKIETKNAEHDCFVPAVINGIMQVKVLKAKLSLFQSSTDLGMYNPGLKLTDAQLSRFFGIIATQADVILTLDKKIIPATTDYMMLGGKLAAGRLIIKCSSPGGGRYQVTDSTGDVFTTEELKNGLLKAGFSKIGIQFNEAEKEMTLTFLAE